LDLTLSQQLRVDNINAVEVDDIIQATVSSPKVTKAPYPEME